MSHPVCYTKRMKIENEILKPIFDLDGTLITEDRESTRLFDFHNAEAILNLEESDLTPLGKLVRDSVRFVLRKLVDNDERNLEGLPEHLAELVTQDQTEF